MSLSPKLMKLASCSVRDENVDFASFTKTWLSDRIHDNVIHIPGYNIARKDRILGHHGGVCLYIKNSIAYQVLSQCQHPPLELLWVKARTHLTHRLPRGITSIVFGIVYHPSREVLWVKTPTHRLPRGITSIVFGIVYHPPSANPSEMIEYLFDQLSFIESTFPSCGLMLLGDFNRLNVSRISSQFRLKQLVKFPTRGSHTLDLVLTNLGEYYSVPKKLPPFGLSDHFTILINPKSRPISGTDKNVVKIRDLRPSRRLA